MAMPNVFIVGPRLGRFGEPPGMVSTPVARIGAGCLRTVTRRHHCGPTPAVVSLGDWIHARDTLRQGEGFQVIGSSSRPQWKILCGGRRGTRDERMFGNVYRRRSLLMHAPPDIAKCICYTGIDPFTGQAVAVS